MESQSSPIQWEFKLLNEIFSAEDRIRFKSMLSPKLKEMWEKVEIFESVYESVKGYLKREIAPPPLDLSELIKLTEELVDDFTFIVRHRLDEETAKQFEKSISKLKKRLEESKKDVVSAAISSEVKTRQISMYVHLASSFVLSYIKVVFLNFKDSLTLLSDVWKPMEEKFAQIAIKRVGVIPEEEEEKKKGGDEI